MYIHNNVLQRNIQDSLVAAICGKLVYELDCVH
jgi:hypothetical protein